MLCDSNSVSIQTPNQVDHADKSINNRIFSRLALDVHFLVSDFPAQNKANEKTKLLIKKLSK